MFNTDVDALLFDNEILTERVYGLETEKSDMRKLLEASKLQTVQYREKALSYLCLKKRIEGGKHGTCMGCYHAKVDGEYCKKVIAEVDGLQ